MKKNESSTEGMMNDRLDFIVRSFNHTHKKKYENYVVTGIWHRLRAKNLMIKPITQQLVRRPDGKYALLDLYFPAINFAVECDENQHFDPNGNYIPEDKLREYDVLKKLAALPVQPELMRIKAVCGLDEIDQQLDHVAAEIERKALLVSSAELWNDESAADFLMRKGELNVSDVVQFEHICDILNAFGFRTQQGEEYHPGRSRGTYRINAVEELWFANLLWQKGEAKYANVWHEETEEIFEYKNFGIENNWNSLGIGKFSRYTFCKAKDSLGKAGYKFYGKFTLASGIQQSPEGYKYLIWRKTDPTINADSIRRKYQQDKEH